MDEEKVKSKEPIFVIGFPKSGNTWLARLLAEVTESNIAVLNPSDGVNNADNSSERKGCYIIHKEHVVNNVEEVLQGKVVYIIRDVRDVLVSAFFFGNKFICEDWVRLHRKCEGVREMLCRAYFRHQIKRLNKHWCGNELSVVMNWFSGNKITLGSWSDHLMVWAKSPNIIVVRYEDLLRETEDEIRKLLLAFGIDVSDEILKKVISNQSFKKKKAEFLRSGDYENAQFLRSGEAGRWRDFLSPAIVKEIEKKHNCVMNKYRYTIEYYEGEK